MKRDIYIIKNSVNDMVYIGQSKDPAKRWLSHVYNARYEYNTQKSKQIIHRHMMEIGIEKFHYEILESGVENPDEREKYWIKRYNSVYPNGYNTCVGGKGTGTGKESILAFFKDEDTLMSCVSEISSGKKTFTNIAKKYGCSTAVISGINLGQYYKIDGMVYPLRPPRKYSQEKVKQIRYSLKYETDIPLQKIAEKYHVNQSQVSEINNGRIYFVKGENYPLRKKRVSEIELTTICDIRNDIIYSDLCFSDIARKYNVAKNTITDINSGKRHRLDGLKYPIRDEKDPRSKSNKRFFDISEVEEIIEELKYGKTLNEIAKMFGTTKETIANINAGKCKKYRIDGVKYPIVDTRRTSVSTILV